MRGKYSPAVLGIVGPLVAHISIALSIYLTPHFSWHINALSDLGHAQNSGVAPIFNMGLLASGFLVGIYSAKSLYGYAKYTSVAMAVSALMLQAVAVFDEIYGFIHFIVSALFFVSALIACLLYSIEARSKLAASALLIGLIAWILHWLRTYRAGAAVPEIISALAVTSIIIHSAIKILRAHGPEGRGEGR